MCHIAARLVHMKNTHKHRDRDIQPECSSNQTLKAIRPTSISPVYSTTAASAELLPANCIHHTKIVSIYFSMRPFEKKKQKKTNRMKQIEKQQR